MHTDFPQDIDSVSLLHAVDGIAYIVDRAGKILALNPDPWSRFAVANAAPELAEPQHVLGRSLYDFIAGEEVRQGQRALADVVWNGFRASVSYIARCDAPEQQRDLRLSITPIRGSAGIIALLYQSLILSEELRPRLGHLEFDRLRAEDPSLPILAICSYCKDVRWPVGAEDGEWLSPEKYYQRGGREAVRLSHTICPDCYREIFAPLLARGNPE